MSDDNVIMIMSLVPEIACRSLVFVCLSLSVAPMTSEYKKTKEAFVSGMTGSTMTHVHLISSVSLASTTEGIFDASGIYKFYSGLYRPLFRPTNA